MRQTLFYIPETLFGLPVFGWGLGLALLIVAVLLTHVYQYAKHQKISDFGSSLALLAIGGALLVFIIPNLTEPGQGIPIRGYGSLLVVAIFVSFFLVLHLAKKQGIPTAQIYALCVWTVITGIIGARLFYVTQYWQEMLCFDPAGQLLLRESLFSVINFAQGGLVVFGSILGGGLGAIIYMLRNNMPMLRTFDVMAPAAALGMAIGRIGCLLNGCCFGGVTDAPWHIVFPPGSPPHVHQVAHGDVFIYGMKFEEKTISGRKVLAIAEVQPNSEAESLGLTPGMWLQDVFYRMDGETMVARHQVCQAALITRLLWTNPSEEIQLGFVAPHSHNMRDRLIRYRLVPGLLEAEVLPVHPAQIYSSIHAFLLCGILLILGRLRLFQQRDGLVLASFMILYSAGRYVTEIIRTDEGSFFGTGLTISQNISIGFGLAGIILLVYLCRNMPAR